MNRHLLTQAQKIVNAELKERFEKGEISSPYEIFYEPTWLDVVHRFNFELDCWADHTINSEISVLLGKIRQYHVTNETARTALKYIAAYIILTESIVVWTRLGYHAQLKYCLDKYYGLNKPLNYDYLRYVLNELPVGNEKLVVVTS